MPNTYRVVHCFQGAGGTSQDMYCNQFYFFCEAHVPADVATWGPSITSGVHNLWAFPLGAGNSIGKYYHSRCFGNQGVTKIYDVTGNPATVGPPIFQMSDSVLLDPVDYINDVNLDAMGLPEEVAVCLSYQAVHTEGDLPRRRGRIYLGPLNSDALIADNLYNPTEVSMGFMDCILNAAQNVQDLCAAADFEWRVFSTMDGFAFKIVNFSVDNAFDTIRGRGRAPSYRNTVPLL